MLTILITFIVLKHTDSDKETVAIIALASALLEAATALTLISLGGLL